MTRQLIAPDSRRIEPPVDAPHYHVWRDHGLAQTIMSPRFGTNQAARQAALRAGMEKGGFSVQKCTLPGALHGHADPEAQAPKVSSLRADPVTTWTWDAVSTAAAATAGWKRTRRGEWRGPCKCGGERDRAWVRRGYVAAAVAGCNGGCPGPEVIRWLVGDCDPHGFRRMRTTWPPRRDAGARTQPETHPESPLPVQPRTAPFSGRAPSTRPNPAPSGRNRGRRSACNARTRTHPTPSPSGFRHPDAGSGGATVGGLARRHPRPGPPGAAVGRTSSPMAARRPVARCGAVDSMEGRRRLIGRGVRTPSRTGGRPTPRRLPECSLSTSAPVARPGRIAAGSTKRNHGPTAAAVAVIGAPLWRAGLVHVAEGLADALAVAAREDGAALAVGGTSGFGRLAPELAALAVPVVVWPDRDDSGAGRIAAGRLVATLRGRGAVASLAAVPDGTDPAAMAGPFTDLEAPA